MRKRTILLLWVTLLLMLAGGCGGDGESETAILSVPAGNPPVIDGAMRAGEWDDAATETFSDGSELLLMQSAGYLYVGIRSVTPEMIVGNVFINRGDEVAILHASAALGTALYEQGEDAWQQAGEFVWRCRRTDDSPAARAERERFMQDEQWVATNSRIGTPNELEYQIEITGETTRLAVNLLRSSDVDAKIPWPADLDDDVIKPTPGGLPAELHFSPETWVTIGLPAAQKP